MLKAEKLEEFPSVKIKEYRSSSRKVLSCPRQKGSILIGLIITMVIMASLGAGMVYLTTTSTFGGLFSNNHARAYYLAESGGRYALARIREAYAQATPALRDAILATIPGTYYDGAAANNSGNFVISALGGNITGSPATVTFSSTGTVNSGFLQAKRQLNYSIQPANQAGGGTPGETITPPLSTLPPLPGTIPPNKITLITGPSGDPGIQVTPASGAGSKYAALLGSSIMLNGNYSVQVKTGSPQANSWMTGIMFNIDPNSAITSTNNLPDGYGLTYFYNWSDNTPPDPDIYDTIPPADQGKPMIILWQSVTNSGVQTYKWIAYKNLALASLPGFLTMQGANYNLDDAVALVAQVTRTSSPSNIIRVYYGSPDNASLAPADATATNDKRLGYNLSNSNIQWPVPTGSWSAATDYFTLLTWDATAPGVATATFSGDGTIEPVKAVITSTDLADPDIYNTTALFLNQSSKPQADFFDFAIFVPPSGGTDGSGSVIQSP